VLARLVPLPGAHGGSDIGGGIILARGIAEPLTRVVDRLTQVMLIMVGSEQALLHESLRDLARDLLVEAAATDCALTPETLTCSSAARISRARLSSGSSRRDSTLAARPASQTSTTTHCPLPRLP